MSTRLGLYGGPTTAVEIGPKTATGLPQFGTRIREFDTWQATYGGASVLVIRAGTTEHAPLYADPQLTAPLPNPQTLLTWTDSNGVRYGKWAQPVYTYVPYRMTINETAVTGIERPGLVELAGQDVSRAIAGTARGGFLQTIQSLTDKLVFASDFGSLAASSGATAVGAVIAKAIGAAAAQGGGSVILPAGDVLFVSLTLPENVVLHGQGPGVTNLISTSAQPVITLSGDRAGLRDLTLDGVNLATGSIGVYGVGLANIVFDRVEVKRFSDGLLLRGASYCYWTDLSVTNCVNAVQLRGDTDPSGAGQGGEVRGVVWRGGAVTLNTTSGVQLWFFDDLVDGVTLDGVLIGGNLDRGLLLNGARNVRVIDGQWEAGDDVGLLVVQDDSNLARRADNTVDHLAVEGTIIRGGRLSFNGTCASVVLRGSDLRGCNLVLSVPDEPILLADCIEDADVTIAGDGTRLLRSTSADEGAVTGYTTDATALTAYQEEIEPGGVVLFQAEVVAQRQDGEQYGIFHIEAGAARPGSTLAFDTQTVNFTAGATVTGATSGATGRIIAVTQAAGSGTLTLGDLTGTFTMGEVLTDNQGGAAKVAGSLTPQNVALDGTGNVALRAAGLSAATTYTAVWDVSGGNLRLRLNGMSGHLVQWTARIRRLRS